MKARTEYDTPKKTYEDIQKYLWGEISKELDNNCSLIGIDIIDVSDAKNKFDRLLLHKETKKYVEGINEDYFQLGHPSLLFEKENKNLYHYFDDDFIKNENPNILEDKLVLDNFSCEKDIQINSKETEQILLDFDNLWKLWIEICKRVLPNFNKLFYVKQVIATTNYYAGVFLYMKCEDKINPKSERHINRILTDFLSYRIAAKILPLQISELKKTSLKSSLAAVMARNQSHNIGSHVLSRTLTSEDMHVNNIIRDWV